MRNKILNVILVVVFIGTTNISAQSKKAKNIILMIGDGMGVAQIYAGYTVNKGKSNFEKFKCIGFSKTSSADHYVTDSGAGGTAISTGKKTKNHFIAVDTTGRPIETILEIAEAHNKSTGLVVTSAITHATPASFIAHNIDRNDYEGIATDFLKTDIDVFIGGGRIHFEYRSDSADLIKKLEDKGYTTTHSIVDIIRLKDNVKKLAGFTAWMDNPTIKDGRGDMLGIGTKKAINILNNSKKGFFLMVEGSQIDWGGHDNDTKYIVTEVIDFDKVIGEVLEFAEKDGNTLVIVTADHETGGMGLNMGDIKTGRIKAKYTSTNHTGTMVPVFAYGPGAENFMGIYENTEIFTKMMESYGFQAKETSQK